MLGGMKGFAKRTIFRPQVVIPLLRASEFGLQTKELVHDILAFCKSLFQLLFEQYLHEGKIASRVGLPVNLARSYQRASRPFL